MRSVWVDSGNDPDWESGARHGINGYYIALSDPQWHERILDIRNRGYAAGVYAAWNWWGDFTGRGAAFAEEVNGRIREKVKFPKPSWPKVQLDNEDHDMNQILFMLRRWRELWPKQDTSWTMESFQGGLMSPEFVQEVISLRVRVVPQAYTGNMQRMSEDGALRDLLRRGFPEALVTLFYDAAQLPINWDGFAFTQGRLP
jgi:hypothetical protein